MNDSKKYSCNGCKYQFEDYSYCVRKHNFDPPYPCYECYIWSSGEKNERKKWESGERVHFSCEGCVYQNNKNSLVCCMSCCTKIDIFSQRKKYKKKLFIENDINDMMDSIIGDI